MVGGGGDSPSMFKYKKVTIQQIWPMQLIDSCSELAPMMVGIPYKCLSAKKHTMQQTDTKQEI